jgi:hypothetical protein
VTVLLEEPFEYLDLMPGEVATYRVDRLLDGTGVIHPRNVTPRHIRQHMDQRGLSEAPAPGTPISVEVPVLRLYSSRLDKPSPVHYVDVSSKTLRADLLARTNNGAALPITIELTAHGVRPHKRYSVEVLA